jgi:predicted peptidase|tara:strand:+ start:2573 stop:3478 length:906 start_codon:yes stop_codon:yes gene_type:complete
MKPAYHLVVLSTLLIVTLFSTGCQTDKLERVSYISQIEGEERDYYLYLPNGYEFSDKDWPVLLFLHGNGERGNGKNELDFVLKHGPLMEAWAYKKDLPFIIISPQLHMFGMDETTSYLNDRDTTTIPRRLEEGLPDREPFFGTPETMDGAESELAEYVTLPNGWDKVDQDLMGMIDHVLGNYRADSNRVYLSGLSYGGFGTWHLASSYPDRFAAIAPVVGWGHPDLMEPIAEHDIPVWAFSGGRDPVVRTKYFYPGINKLEELGHTNVRFTTHEDMGHDAWKRIYGGDDLYNWLLEQQLEE